MAMAGTGRNSKKMATACSSVRQLLTENSVDDFIAAADILIKFASNVLDNPSVKKYRRIRISNLVVQNKLLNVVGGMECLFEMGFEEIEDGEFLMLPLDANLEVLERIKNDLHWEREKLFMKPENRPDYNFPTSTSNSAETLSTNQALTKTIRAIQPFPESEAAFLARMKEGMKRVLNYENPSTKQKARQVMPIDSIQSEAKENFKSSLVSSLKMGVKDYLLLALLGWFKKSFFQWVDTLPCSLCQGATSNSGSLTPSSDDLRWGAGRVEAHKCNTCGHINRFPRYTNAEKLLETRRGRCGEWADCFTLCCRALDFEARYVMDWTDHVWTEVFSETQSRWLHCDPCENICDKPLLYESGWGKKLTYVIAVSCDEVQDVTWRYSAKHNDLLARRTLCRESWLRRTIHQLWRQKVSTLTQQRQRELWHRLICELTEFVTVKNIITEKLPGRSTGSLVWRQARGELGAAAAAAAAVAERSVMKKNFVFFPTEAERECELIHVVYSCSMDKYIRKSEKNEEYKGWESCIHSASHTFRKEELDWKMVYIARNEGSTSAEVIWKFDVTGTDLRISKMELKAETAVYESGSITWRICADESCFIQTGASLQQFKSFDLRGCQSLSIIAVMQGGNGELAWQHAQLFRQPLDDVNNFPFEIKLSLN